MADETPFNLAIQETPGGARLTILTLDGVEKASVRLDLSALRVASDALAAIAGAGIARTFTPEKAHG